MNLNQKPINIYHFQLKRKFSAKFKPNVVVISVCRMPFTSRAPHIMLKFGLDFDYSIDCILCRNQVQPQNVSILIRCCDAFVWFIEFLLLSILFRFCFSSLRLFTAGFSLHPSTFSTSFYCVDRRTFVKLSSVFISKLRKSKTHIIVKIQIMGARHILSQEARFQIGTQTERERF